MPIDRRLLLNIDWVLLLSALLLAAIGVFTIHSATHSGRYAALYLKQLYLLGAGITALLLVLLVDYRRLADRALLFYGLTVVALLYVLRFSPVIAGTRRWILLGGFQLQPSELAKLVAALLVAKIFAESRHGDPGPARRPRPGRGGGPARGAHRARARPRDRGLPGPALPGRRLPGRAAHEGGARRSWWSLVCGRGGLADLQDYQKTRVYTFLDPSLDPQGAGYQKIQSQIAVGSGGLSGKGWKRGARPSSATCRRATPISSSRCSPRSWASWEWSTVLGLYLLLLWRMLETAQLARDRVGAFLVAGIAATFTFQVVYNVAMVAGLVPVKGLPLPLMSYGGSSILASLIAVGLILNVRMRRFAN